jgi:hypothetical protein
MSRSHGSESQNQISHHIEDTDRMKIVDQGEQDNRELAVMPVAIESIMDIGKQDEA